MSGEGATRVRRRVRLPRRLDPEHVAHEAGAPALELVEVGVRYGERTALEGVSLRLDAGDLLAVVGPNGAGKSTLLKVIAGVLSPSAGDVRVFGRPPRGHICIAYVPQRSQVDWAFPVSVSDVVMMGRIDHLGPLRRPRVEDRTLVATVLERVGVAHLADRPIAELSGGEQQRMFLARALAQEAELVLLDEPLAGLDVPSQAGILDLIGSLSEGGATTLVTLHDVGLAAKRFGKILLLRGRPIALGTPEAAFRPEALHAAYGSGLHLERTEGGLVATADSSCPERVEDGRV